MELPMQPNTIPGHGLATALAHGAPGATQLLEAGSGSATTFHETNLVSDLDSAGLQALGFSAAAYQDPSLINPWGMDHTATGDWLIVDNGDAGSGSGFAAGGYYTGAGVKHGNVTIQQTAVGAFGAGAPVGATGVVFDPSTGQFVIGDLDGHISTLNAGASSSVEQITGPTPAFGPPHSVYTGVAIGQIDGQTYIYGANNGTGAVDVYGPNLQPATLEPGAFAAPPAAAGLAAFNVQNLDGHIWVSYAIPGPSSDDAPLGSGLVAEFTPEGQLITSFGDSQHMASPYAMVMAPSSFGTFAGDLLVGNFSHDDPGQAQDAFINAYDPATGAYKGTLDDANGNPILLPGLWQIEAGNNAAAGSSGNLYFVAGIGDEAHGLFGYLSPNVTAPAAWSPGHDALA
jgi:uncharacterized protein (TIGR03118 family)